MSFNQFCALVIATLLALLFSCLWALDTATESAARACEAAGGAYLKHAQACVRKDLVVQPKEKAN